MQHDPACLAVPHNRFRLACLAELPNMLMLASLLADAATAMNTVLPCALLLTPDILHASLIAAQNTLAWQGLGRTHLASMLDHVNVI